MFNPIVQPKQGLPEDLRRVWCAENVKIALDAVANGIPLISAPFLIGNVLLRRPNILYDWNDWELQEAIKCRNDIVYFAEHYCELFRPDGTYGLIKLREYQKRYLRLAVNNRFVIFLAARQVGKTTTTAILLLWMLIFGMNQKIALLGDKFATAAENIMKIRQIYERLPFFLKPGVVGANKSSLMFDNNNYIFCGPCNLGTIVGRTISVLYFDEMAIPEDAQMRPVWEFASPTISALTNSKILCTSSPRGDGVFKEIYLGAVAGKNGFVPFKVDWWEVPGRDQAWKEQQVALLGERGFEQQYGNKFLSNGNDWLTEETSEYMDLLMANSHYIHAYNMTDREDIFAKLHKVEPLILRSRYVNQSTLVPDKRLVDMLVFDHEQIGSLDELRTTPLIITIDSGEGRRNDYTIVNFFRPELDEDKSKLLEESKVDIEAEAMFNKQDDDEDPLDTMVDDVDIDSMDEEYVMINSVRCRQIGILSTNIHCMPMVALFVQIFVKSFCDEDKVKIVCELDGCGSLMQQYLAMDIVKNSALDSAAFGTTEKKGNPGVYMRGKNKLKFITQTESLLSESRILVSYAATIFEMRKFVEIKPGKWQGNGVHDDQTMSVCQLGAYMSSPDFIAWIEDILSPDEPNDDDDNDVAA